MKDNRHIIILSAILLVVAAFTAYLLALYNDVPTFEESVTMLETQSESTEIEDIESDVDNTELDNLDAEISEIEKELDEALEEL